MLFSTPIKRSAISILDNFQKIHQLYFLVLAKVHYLYIMFVRKLVHNLFYFYQKVYFCKTKPSCIFGKI